MSDGQRDTVEVRGEGRGDSGVLLFDEERKRESRKSFEIFEVEMWRVGPNQEH